MKLSDAGEKLYWVANTMVSRGGEDGIPIAETEVRSEVERAGKLFPGVSREELEYIVRKLIEVNGVRKDEEDEFIACNHDRNWYSKRKEQENLRFGEYRNLLVGKNWSRSVVAELDKSTDTIMNFLGNPQEKEFNVKGLIMGDVQSGKTTCYTALCNKAADAGYRVIIVTAGIIEKLRKQTQQSLNSELAQLVKNHVYDIPCLTSEQSDFQSFPGAPISVFKDDRPVLLVVKKNTTVLDKVLKWITPDDDTWKLPLDYPLLFIDDEADNASINTKEETDPTKTNGLIRKILKAFSKSSYVGITATPFANIFIDPDVVNGSHGDDLFPKDFVYRLTPPSNYFSSRSIFAKNSVYCVHIDYVDEQKRHIDDLEKWLPANHKKDEFPTRDLPGTLKDAIGYFMLACGIMDVLSEEDPIPHRTMMIHISRFIEIQNRIADYISEYVNMIRSKLSNYSGDPVRAEECSEIQHLKRLWERFELSLICNHMDWGEFLGTRLLDAIDTLAVVTVNSKQRAQNNAFDYENGGKRYIVVGGNALARGLVLKDLVVSYFRRDSIMSDALLQMGRWCGYRGKFQKLVKVWLPESADDSFGYALNISDDVAAMFHQIVAQKGTPSDFAFKLAKSPAAFLPTARNKMKSTVVVRIPVTLDGCAVDTPRIINDPLVCKKNDETIVNMLIANKKYIEPDSSGRNVIFYRNLPYHILLDCLESLEMGMMSFSLDISNVRTYISEKAKNWDLAIRTATSGDFFDAEGRLPFKIRVAKRKLRVSDNGQIVQISGTKLKVTSGGAMELILSAKDASKVKNGITSGTGDGETKSPRDADYLAVAEQQNKRPLLILQYTALNELAGDIEPNIKSFFAMSFGFPGTLGNGKTVEMILSKRAQEAMRNQREEDASEDDDEN